MLALPLLPLLGGYDKYSCVLQVQWNNYWYWEHNGNVNIFMGRFWLEISEGMKILRFEDSTSRIMCFSGMLIVVHCHVFHVCFSDLICSSNYCQVQWDEPSSILRPDKVSPWELEPLDAANPQPPQPPLRNKRSRPPASPSVVPELPPKFGKISERLSTCYK